VCSRVTGSRRITVDGRELSLPGSMVGSAALIFISNELGLDPSESALARKADGSYVGESQAIGDVLHDGDELELVPRPG
jgi:hypothetical protein